MRIGDETVIVLTQGQKGKGRKECVRTFPRYNLIEIFERLNLITV